MIVSHLVALYTTDPNDDSREIELTATVSLVSGTRDELEVEWTADSQPHIDSFDRAAAKALEQRARECWWDVMAKLDQPTEEDERGYWEQEQRRYEVITDY